MEKRSDLESQFAQLEKLLPKALCRIIHWLRGPSSCWVRIPVALLLIAGGFLGFLPILGFWMIPLGLILIAQDVPILEVPIARMLAWGLDKWARRKNAGGRESPRRST